MNWKLEGAALSGYRTVSFAGVRNPIFISQIDEIIKDVETERQITSLIIKESDYKLISVFTENGVMGSLNLLQMQYRTKSALLLMLLPGRSYWRIQSVGLPVQPCCITDTGSHFSRWGILLSPYPIRLQGRRSLWFQRLSPNEGRDPLGHSKNSFENCEWRS